LAENKFARGLHLLNQPVMPLVSMLRFLYMTGDFATVAEVVAELPEPIETDKTVYEHPRALLSGYLDSLAGLEELKREIFQDVKVVDEEGNPVDPMTGGTALVLQKILAAELEHINSQLCSPCGCTLCCVGPDHDMEQEFFEIPLAAGELDMFPVVRHESEASRSRRAGDEDELLIDGQPFYRVAGPELVHWQSGWSLILPRGSRCPNLEEGTGRCMVYPERPDVCRRPQIFPYMVEPLDAGPDAKPAYRIRQSLLAITDCPYVGELRDEIAGYAAASELHMVFNRNKA